MAGGSKKGLWISLVALVVVIAVACVLVFVVFQDRIFGGATEPEKKVQEAMTAIEGQDLDGLFGLLDPQGVQYLEQTNMVSAADLKDALGEALLGFESVTYSGVKMETVMESDGEKATVTIVDGKMTTVSRGETIVEDIKDSEDDKYYLILRDGVWYLDIVRMSREG